MVYVRHQKLEGGNSANQSFVFTVNATLVQQALGTLAQLGYEGLKAEDLGRLIQADPFEEELNVMADVMAYFHVAYKVQFL